ncbi:MAG: hypothetical protein H0U43_07845 [Chthoniobacterales bacterium]|nr:hypothetical protein [Chthoniobacterales bacterium]
MEVALGVALIAFVLFNFSTNGKMNHMDYTYRIADALLHGDLGLRAQPPSRLNEAVPFGGKFYSVFPLGAVVSMLPVAFLKEAKLVDAFPGRAVASVIAATSVYFFFQLSAIADVSLAKRAFFSASPIFGTWTWCNLGFGGAWQIALGFALLGTVASFYFTLVKPNPWVAGACFALAFGNRTELILITPFYLYFWAGTPRLRGRNSPGTLRDAFRENWRPTSAFVALPLFLGLCTLGYNYARFGSLLDFGYSRIPGVLQEPWYRHGLFSFHAIPWNAYKMLFEGLVDIPQFPYLRPHGFGASILLTSPLLFLVFREGGKYRAMCWSCIGILTLFLWCHGNPGGWQFSYRYATILLPWIFLLLLTNGPRGVTATETALAIVSFALNEMATYQFLWTDQIKP